MYTNLALTALAASSLFGSAHAMYTKNSPVLQVTAKNYNSLIAQSNHTSIVEFYAPWCGHCKNLKPAYEKAATKLAGLAKVAAINCDEDENKGLCSQMGVQGFPTLKIVKPGAKKGRPTVEDYQGPRTASGIVGAVTDKIPNHVKKVQDSDLEAWLGDTSSTAKALLFTEKGTTSSLIRAVAIDFLGSINFAQIRNKEKKAVEKFGVTKFPTLVLLSGEGKDPILYDGELKKDAIVKFFSQVSSPNPDPAPKKAKASSSKKTKPADKTASSKFASASEAHKSSDYDEHMQHAGTTILEDDVPTESPLPIVEHEEKPLVIKDAAAPIPQLASLAELRSACLEPKSGTCILVLLPPTTSEDASLSAEAIQALGSFAEIADKHKQRHANIFPFYEIPAANEGAEAVRKGLGLNADAALEIVAINKKRKWWRQYTAASYEVLDVENFVDAIKLGEGTKQKLPADFFAEGSADTTQAEPEPSPEPVAEPSPHDEL